jgi:hypothetical protein
LRFHRATIPPLPLCVSIAVRSRDRSGASVSRAMDSDGQAEFADTCRAVPANLLHR